MCPGRPISHAYPLPPFHRRKTCAGSLSPLAAKHTARSLARSLARGRGNCKVSCGTFAPRVNSATRFAPSPAVSPHSRRPRPPARSRFLSRMLRNINRRAFLPVFSLLASPRTVHPKDNKEDNTRPSREFESRTAVAVKIWCAQFYSRVATREQSSASQRDPRDCKQEARDERKIRGRKRTREEKRETERERRREKENA